MALADRAEDLVENMCIGAKASALMAKAAVNENERIPIVQIAVV
jgi:hypothetical protein